MAKRTPKKAKATRKRAAAASRAKPKAKAKAKPAAKKPAAKKPAATKPAATKPAANKPAANKPAANKPVKAASKPAPKKKPAAKKPAKQAAILGDDSIDAHRLETGMSDVVAIEIQAEAALEAGDARRAVALYTRLIETSNTPMANHLVARGRAYYGLADYERAIADFQRGQAMEPRFPDLHFDKGKAELQAGRVADAEASFTHDLEIDPSPISFYNRHLARKALGNRDGALADLDAAIDGMPDEIPLRVARAMLRASGGDNEGAFADAEAALKLDPSDVTLHERCGRLALALGRHQRAAEAYAQARRILVEAGEVPDVEHLTGEALALGHLARHGEALALLDQAAAIAPEDPTVCCNRGWMHHLAGRDTEAVIDLDRAIALDPGYAKALQNRAAIHLSRGDRQRALADYRRLDELGHDVSDVIARLVAP